MRALFAVLLSVITLSADAALTYRFSMTTNAPTRPSVSGRVWIDGERQRIELDLDPSIPRMHDVTIVAGGKTTFLNLQNKTYFHETYYTLSGRKGSSSPLLDVPAPPAPLGRRELKGKPKFEFRREGSGEPLDGYETVRYVLQASYRADVLIQGNAARADMGITLMLLVVPSLPRVSEPPLIRTTFSKIDDEIGKLMASIEGMIVKKDLSITRKFEGGPVVAERTTTVINELKAIDRVDDKLFAIPADFRFQEPVVAAPGR